MKSNRELKAIILIIFGMLFAFLNIFINKSSFIVEDIYIISNYNREESLNQDNLKISDISGKIHIDNNWTDTKNAGLCTGSGNYSDPYIIENLIIDANGSGSCIHILNSVKHFIIRNCTLYNSGSYLEGDGGIKLEYVNNGKLIGNNCSYNSGNGISLINCNNINISRNIVNYNTNHGLRLGIGCAGNIILNNTASYCQIGIFLYNIYDSINPNIVFGNKINNNNEDGIYLNHCLVNIDISGNRIYNNTQSGIHLNYVAHAWIIDNLIDNNKDYGIYIQGSTQPDGSCKISKNNITNHNYGIYMIRGYNNEIYLNNVNYNTEYGICLFDSLENEINDNTVDKNKNGIYLEKTNHTDIAENNINNNIGVGLHLVDSNDNKIYNNNLCENNVPVHEDKCERNDFKNNVCYKSDPPKNGFPLEMFIIVLISIVSVMFAIGMIIFRKKTSRDKLIFNTILDSQELEQFRKTETEVNVEKEHHFCIVHKGKIVGAMYLCPKCENYYCMKCATVLKKKGERCWVCNNKIEL